MEDPNGGFERSFVQNLIIIIIFNCIILFLLLRHSRKTQRFINKKESVISNQNSYHRITTFFSTKQQRRIINSQKQYSHLENSQLDDSMWPYFSCRLYERISIIQGRGRRCFEVTLGYSYDHVSNSLASGHGIRAKHRWYAVPGRDNSRDSVSEQKMRLCRTHASKRRCFPWSRAPTEFSAKLRTRRQFPAD